MVTTSVTPEGAGKITPATGQVLEGSTVTFRAEPQGEYMFTGWSGSINGNENPKSVVIQSDMSVTAQFTLRTYPLSLATEGEGAVSEKVISTKTDYFSGTIVELTAKAADHWLFDHWEGDLNGNTNPAQITVSSTKNVKAVFVKKMYDLTVEVDGDGSVSETVVETKSGSYQEGTTVELTATPGTGWSFDHWEGDLTGSDNPARISISSAKTVKAVFSKNHYAYTLKIVGPGVVDEYLMAETKASLEYNSKVLLRAYPADGAFFKGWSGALSGTQTEVYIDIDDDKEIIATFEKPVKTYPLPDLMLPSVSLKMLYPGVRFDCAGGGHVFGTFDYNRDGFPDVISCPLSPDGLIRNDIDFYTGNADGSFEKDTRNTIADGPIWTRKIIYGDFNGDGLTDICMIGHGWDYQPWPGEYPILLFSNPDGSYTARRLTDYVSFFHGGTSADFDNDGDLDIFLICSWHGEALFLINDGQGNFSPSYDMFNQSLRYGMYNTEMYDLDKDGFMDLIVGAHDHEYSSTPDAYENTPVVIWGNGTSFNHNNFTRLPKTPIKGFGIVTDFDFSDIDGDGQDEILLARTGDNTSIDHPSYIGWSIQVVKREDHAFYDITDQVLGLDASFNSSEGWIVWINMEEFEGSNYLAARKSVDADLLYELKNGRLVVPDMKEEKYPAVQHGFPILTGALHMKDGWKKYDSFGFEFEEGLDLSALVEQDYYLELYLKNTDPTLTFDYHLEISQSDTSVGNPPMYGTGTNARDLKNDGDWERICIPLSRFELWDRTQNNYWNRITKFVFITTSTGGQEFFVKDIRIRRVLPE